MTLLSARGWPAGYRPLRILSEGEGGVVALASKASDELVALKLLPLAVNANPDEALARHRRLASLTTSPGLLHIRECGLSADRCWLWEELDPADDLDGKPPSAEDNYQPATLRTELIERGALTVGGAVEVGRAICGALETLHAHGLVHRDVKPGNLLRVGGQVVLGDYGLVGTPGTAFDFKGTEGFVPSEGVANEAADLFALGKSLYELWTGCDRLEYPTLPTRVLEHAEWNTTGFALNEVLLRACAPEASRRYHNTAEFTTDLQAVAESRMKRMHRRRWILGSAAAALITVATGVRFLATRKRPVLRWRQVKKWSWIPAMWGNSPAILDERRGKVFQVWLEKGKLVLHTVDLATLDVKPDEFKSPVEQMGAAILHPTERTLWFVENGRGPVWRLNPDSGAISFVGGSETATDTDFDNSTYWNPVANRLGVFGGYGYFRVHNWRWEFDTSTGRWLSVEVDAPKRQPWCRSDAWLLRTEVPSQLLVFSGSGNSTGKQNQHELGMPDAGHFDDLADLWTLDLETGKRTCLVPVPGPRILLPCLAAYLSAPRTVVVVARVSPEHPNGTPPKVFIFRCGRDRSFQRIASVGDLPKGQNRAFGCALADGRTLLAFFETGIYTATLESE